MKKNNIWKRICAVLLTGVLAFPVFGVNAKADGDKYQGTESYVLNYNGEYSVPGNQYLSCYKPRATKAANTPGARTAYVFNLYNPENGDMIPAYCVDAWIQLNNGADYRRMNLEDATHFDGGAGLMRSVVLNGFPTKTAAELGAAADVEELTISEAVLATQLAVWRTAYGEAFPIYDFWYDTIDLKQKTPNQILYIEQQLAEFSDGYPNRSDPDEERATEARIEAVYNYLMNLEPTAPLAENKAVSNDSFVEWSVPEVVKNADGTYDVTVKVVVSVNIAASDKLELSAVLGDGTWFASKELQNGTNEITLTIENVPVDVAFEEVKLTIDGKQTVSDVYLFDAAGPRVDADREYGSAQLASQTLVGVYGKQLPVHAEVVAEPERVLNIYKTAKIPVGENGDGTIAYTRYPLANITFDLYHVATLEEYLYGDFNPDEDIDIKELVTPVVINDANCYFSDYVLITDEDGKASVSLSKNELPDGVYVVAERENPAIDKTTSKPFYIMFPTTNESGDGWEYEITAEPKNGVIDGPEIRKDVIEIEHEDKSGEEEQKASVNAGVPFTWIVRGDVPADISDAKSYVMTDTLDERLTYAENMIVKVAAKTDDANTESEDCVLTAAKDYTVEATKSDSDIWEIKVSLTDIGMDRVARLSGTNPSDYEVRVYFDTVIDEDAQMGDDIPNKATLDYTNSVNFSFNHESDEPVVYTCGINLYKYAKGNENEALAGAKFKLARVATQEEIDAGLSTPLVLGLISGRAEVVYVDFYDNADWTVAADETTADGETAATSGRVNVVTTNTEGKAMLYGLEAGEYYLVEIQAPAGYNMLNYPIKVTLDKTSAIADNEIKVANSDGFQLPATGGMGTVLFTVVGAGIVSGAGVSLVFKKRREDEE